MSKEQKIKYASNSAEASRLWINKEKIKHETEEELKWKHFLIEKQTIARLTREACAIKRKLLLWEITVLSAQASLRQIEAEAKESWVNIKWIIKITWKSIEAIIEKYQDWNS